MSEGIVGAQVGEPEVNPIWKWLLWPAAVFNFAIGMMAMLSPTADVDARAFGLLIFCFGIIYLLVARDPARFGSTLWAGVIGKGGVVGLLLPVHLAADGDPFLLGVLVIDALFAIGFLAFLLTRGD